MLDQINRYPKYSASLVAVLIAIDIFFSVLNAVDLTGFVGIGALVMASALFACLIILTRSMQIFFIFAPSFVISLIASGNVICAFLGLAYIPLGFILSSGIRQKLSRTQIITRLSAVIMVFYTAALILTFFLSTGAFTVKNVRNVIDEQAADVIDYYNFLLSRYSANGALNDGEGFMTESDRNAYIESLKAIVPAFLVIVCNTAAFLITFMFRLLYNTIIVRAKSYIEKGIKKREKIPKSNWKITMSLISTVIFVVCIFALMVASGSDSVWAVIVLSNMIYILAPGLFIVGFYFIHDKIKSLCKSNYISVVLIFLFIAVVMILFTSFALMTFIFCGVYSIQVAEIKKLAAKIKKSFDDDFDDDE